jgi:hypothetical protein
MNMVGDVKRSKTPKLRKFEFAVVAEGVDFDDPAFEDRFFEAGCSDALITVIKGSVVLEFTRAAKNFAHAIASAIRDVQRAGARVRRVEPDSYVSLSDIAERAGLTRQSISLLVSGARGPGDFPPPKLRVTSDSPLWDWLTVARWLHRHHKLPNRDELVFAALARALNALFEGEPSRRKSVGRLLAAA